MSTKPSDKEASKAGSEAHSSDPEKRKEAMATLRDKAADSSSGKKKSDKDD